jgi:hypothetical protein
VAAILDQSPDLYEKTGIDAPVPKPSGSATEPPDSLPLAKVRVVAREVSDSLPLAKVRVVAREVSDSLPLAKVRVVAREVSDSDPTVIPRRHDMIRSVVTTN